MNLPLVKGIDFDLKDVDIDLTRIVSAGVFVLAVLVGGWIVYRIGRTVIRRAAVPNQILREEAAARAETTRALLLSVWKYAVLIGMGAVLLTLVPAALVPTVAFTSAVGLTIAFGAQWLFRDVIAGFSILMEGQFVVGDRVHLYGVDVEGVVESVGLRITIVRDDDGSRVFVPNGAVTAIRNLSQARPEDEARRARGGRSRGGRGRGGRTPRAAAADAETPAAVEAQPGGRGDGRRRTKAPSAGAVPAMVPEPPTGPSAPAPQREAPAPIFELPGASRPQRAADETASAASPAPRRTRRGGRGRPRRPSRRTATGRATGEGDANGEAAGESAEPRPTAEPRDVLEESPWSIE